MNFIQIETQLGEMIIAEQDNGLRGAWFTDQRHFAGVQPAWQAHESPLLKRASQQMQAYFNDQNTPFDLPLAPQGSDFQQAVWQQLLAIPCGQTLSYGAVAEALGKKSAVRAVGAAIGKNPLGVIIPCHRVMASNGALTGYAGGLERKQWLLQHEGALLV